QEASQNIDNLKSIGVTHIVSLGYDFKPTHVSHGIHYHMISIDDDVDANLLQYIPSALEFMDEAITTQNGTVLVHCVAGISRSATIVVAYLMKSNNMSFEESMEFVKSKKPNVEPNEGFVTQLRLFGAMGCRIDINFPQYRRFLMSQMAIEHQGMVSFKVIDK
ncbi:phosphatase, partial [Chytridiales sp. JEL 0842]